MSYKRFCAGVAGAAAVLLLLAGCPNPQFPGLPGLDLGQLEFLSQSRFVFARSGDGAPDETHAAGFEDFDATATKSVTVDAHDDDYTDTFTAQAAQTSTFALTARVSATLTGRLFASFDTGGTNVGPSVAAALFNGAAPVFGAETDPSDGDQEEILISESLTLEPGDYTLKVYARAVCRYSGSPDGQEVGGGGYAEYSLELLIETQ